MSGQQRARPSPVSVTSSTRTPASGSNRSSSGASSSSLPANSASAAASLGDFEDDEKTDTSDDDSTSDSSDYSSDSGTSSSDTDRDGHHYDRSRRSQVERALADLDIGLASEDAAERTQQLIAAKAVASGSSSSSTSALAIPRNSPLTSRGDSESSAAGVEIDSPSMARQRRLEELRRQEQEEQEEAAAEEAAEEAAAISHSSSISATSAAASAVSNLLASQAASTPALPPPPVILAASAPSTLSLLHWIQRYHSLCSHLQQSLSHYVSSQTQTVMQLEEDLTKAKFVEWILRLVREHTTGGGSGHHSTQSQSYNQLALHAAFTHVSTASLLNSYSINAHQVLFDKKKIQVNKPFGYAQEMEYRRLIHLLRARPSLLSFALASFQWSLIQPSVNKDSVLSTSTPLIDPGQVAAHKRSMDSVARCVVWDVFGQGAADGLDGGANGAQIERQVTYMVRMTIRMMWHKELAAARDPRALPLHLFEAHAFLPKLLHEYFCLVGQEFLQKLLKEIVQLVMLHEENLDFNTDLTAMMNVNPNSGSQDHYSPKDEHRSFPDHNNSNKSTFFTNFTPQSTPPSLNECSSFNSPPMLNGRSSNNLFDICTTLLVKLHENLSNVPRGIRKIAREIAKLTWETLKPNAASSSTPPTTADLLPFDPNFDRAPTRLLSDLFFLNWIVQGLIFPEVFHARTTGTVHASGGLTDNYPVSALAKRNLQAIGTVLIKLTSGSRISPFAAAQKEEKAANAAAASSNNGNLNQPSVHSPGKQNSASKLDRFLEVHQPRICVWLQQALEVDPTITAQELSSASAEATQQARARAVAAVEEERRECSEMERSELDPYITLPAGWKGLTELHWCRVESGLPPSELNPILLLPNDLFALHGLVKGCWNAAVTVKIATTPTKKMKVAAANGGQPLPVPVPIPSLPFPAFPNCLIEASACATSTNSAVNAGNAMTANGEPLPYSVDFLSLLISSLANLGDVANFVPTIENMYLLLDAGLSPLKMPPELSKLRTEWPFGDARLRHGADVLLGTLSVLPTFPEDPYQNSRESFQQLLNQFAHTHRLTSHTNAAAQAAATANLLASTLPLEWVHAHNSTAAATSFQPFLLVLLHSLLKQAEIMQKSHNIASRMLLNYGLFQRTTDSLSRRDVLVNNAFKALQTKRLLELTRPKIRRLKKFLAIKTDPRAAAAANAQQGGGGSGPNNVNSPGNAAGVQNVAQPVGKDGKPLPPSANSNADLPACAGACPENAAQDRFLCVLCSRLLDRRRGLLRSFVSKYVIGEGVVLMAAASPGGEIRASINAFAVPDPSSSGSPNPNQANANANGGSTLFVSVGVGPPLDIKDPIVAADIQDYILSSAYPELFVRCQKADDSFFHHMHKLAQFFQYDFASFYVYMQLMDLLPNADKALHVYEEWRKIVEREKGRKRSSSATLSTPTAAKPEIKGLEGHPTVTLDLSAYTGGTPTKPKQLRIPYLGKAPLSQAFELLRNLDSELKPKRKLESCVTVRSLLLTTLGGMSYTLLSSEGSGTASSSSTSQQIQQRISTLTPFAPPNLHAITFSPLHPSNSIAQAPDDLEAGSVEDYMSALCFALLLSNPPFFVSNMQFLKALYPNSATNAKGFVDLLVAMKYLEGVWASLAPTILHRESVEEARLATARAREAKIAEERELERRAAELNEQMQQDELEYQWRMHREQQQQQQQQAAESKKSQQEVAPAVAPPLPARPHSHLMRNNSAEQQPLHAPSKAPTPPFAEDEAPLSSPIAASNSAAAPPPALEAIRSRLVELGFPLIDINEGMTLLAASDRIAHQIKSPELAFSKLLDFCSVIGQLTEMGYERRVIVPIIEQKVGLDNLSAEQVIHCIEQKK